VSKKGKFIQTNLFYEGLKISVMVIKAIFDMSAAGSLKMYASFICEILGRCRGWYLPSTGEG